MPLKQVLPLCFFLLASSQLLAEKPQSDAYISIIIDDVGYNLSAAKQLITLPQALTISILPYSPHGQGLAELAHQHNKEIMLHLPMESDEAKTQEPHTLMLNMENERFKQAFHASLQRIPYVAGVNNHMGSKLTRSPNMMDWLMNEMAETPLYFVDSRTTTETVAETVALHYSIPVLARDVFIDNDRRPEKIKKQLMRLKKTAIKKGYALAIGHPHAETSKLLIPFLQTLNNSNIRLVPVSQLIRIAQAEQDPELLLSISP